MDVTGATSLAVRMAVSRLDDGDAVEFDDVRFRLLNGRLHVESFSHLTPEVATPLHAQQRIARSKAVLDAFAQLCPSFGEVAERRTSGIRVLLRLRRRKRGIGKRT